MSKSRGSVSRRGFLKAATGATAGTTAGVATGMMAMFGAATPAVAAEMTAAERANVQIVNDFCAAWPSHDLAKVMAFFADNGAYRMTETTELAKGREAVTARVKTIIDRVDRFEVIETFARGPMVINERIDRFSNFQLKTWHGVGVFFIQGGKIVDWYDYTIAMERT